MNCPTTHLASSLYNNNNNSECSKVTVDCQVRTRIPTSINNGSAVVYVYLYKNNIDDKEHLALVYGDKISSKSLYNKKNTTPSEYWQHLGIDINNYNQNYDPAYKHESILTRAHSECFTGETIYSKRCDCGEQLKKACEMISNEGNGVVLYLRQEGRGIGLLEKLKAYNVQDLGYDTVQANEMLNHPADKREYNIASEILKDLNINSIKLLTNNPSKVEKLKSSGIGVEGTVSMIPDIWNASSSMLSTIKTESLSEFEETDPAELINNNYKELNNYLITKVNKMGHTLEYPFQMFVSK